MATQKTPAKIPGKLWDASQAFDAPLDKYIQIEFPQLYEQFSQNMDKKKFPIINDFFEHQFFRKAR